MTAPHLADLARATTQLHVLLKAADLLADSDDFAALDARDNALRDLAALGVGHDALRRFARLGPTDFRRIVPSTPSGVGHRVYLTRRLIVIAEGSETPPPR